MTTTSDIFGERKRPMYKGKIIYRDMADNLSKIKFPVIVTESYNPNVHYSFMREGAPPPIFSPSPCDESAKCRSMLPGDFIIDALVTGQEISFEDPDDMEILADWIEQYLKSYEGMDLSKFPDRLTFNMNAKRALDMMRGNILRKHNWEQEVRPVPLTLEEIMKYI